MGDNQLTPQLDPRKLARDLSNKLLINGAMVPALSGRTFAILNPATQEPVGDAAEGGAEDVAAAVTAAQKAQLSWAKLARSSFTKSCGEIRSPASSSTTRTPWRQSSCASVPPPAPEPTTTTRSPSSWLKLCITVEG